MLTGVRTGRTKEGDEVKIRRTALAVVVVIASCLIAVSADDKTVAGQWTVSAEGYTMSLHLTQNGKQIAGTLQSPHGPVKITGEFDKSWLAFSGASDGDPHALELIAKGILRADGTLAGVMTSNVGDFTWTGVRALASN
jgi:hypothetical protein